MISLETILPFFFVLAIVYGSLEVSDVFKNRGVKTIISLVIAFFAMTSPQIIEMITFILPYAAIFFVALFFIGFLMSFFKDDKDKKKKDASLLIMILALVLIFLSNQENIGIINIQDQNFVGMIVLLIIAIILYSAYKKEVK